MSTAFILSGGIPILLLWVSLCFTSRYYTDKYSVIKFRSRPSIMDSSLNTLTVNKIIPVIFFIKIIVSILMFSCPSIFPEEYES